MNEERIKRAERLLAEVRAAGCVVAVEGGLVTYRPPPAMKLMVELNDLNEEMLRLLQPLSLVKTELGFEVPPKPGEEYRVHTAARWKEQDPESYEMCCELIRMGMVNQTALANEVSEHRKTRGLDKGVSRQSVAALMMREFGQGKLEEIIRTKSAIVVAQSLDKMEELVDKAKAAKDLGAVAMGLNVAMNTKQLASGGATRITGKTEEGGQSGFAKFMEKAQAKLREKRSQAPMIDVNLVSAEPVVTKEAQTSAKE